MNSQVPVLFLTARAATKDVMEGYASGGNDYLKKPFSLDELFLRIQELLRRKGDIDQPSEEPLWIGQYQFILHKQTLQFSSQIEIQLSHRETQLLQMLYEYRNTILHRKKVLIALWGDDNFFNGRTMDVFITKLRKHLKQDGSVHIINLRGIGYKLVC